MVSFADMRGLYHVTRRDGRENPEADREPSRLAADGNGFGCWTLWRFLALVAAASRDGS